MKILSDKTARSYGYSQDKRKRRREHRQAAIQLRKEDTRGSSILQCAIAWHKYQARWLGR